MSAIIPIISGPAIVTWNGNTYYAKAGVQSAVKRDSFKVEALGATIDERMKSQEAEISFIPAGLLETMTKYVPYDVADIGRRLIDPASMKPLVIIPLEGDKITYPSAFCSKIPTLRLKATDTLFDSMAFRVFGDPNKEPTDAAAFQTVASNSFSDTSFDETKLITDLYTAAFGSSPYDAIESIDGFEIAFALEIAELMVENYGKLNATLKSMSVSAKFKPANLAEGDIAALISLQDAEALRPGQSFSKAGTDLVISGSGGVGTLVATLYSAGPKDSMLEYDVAKLRQGEISFTSKRKWTAGAADPFYDLSLVSGS